MFEKRLDLAVIGAGITGLAAAHRFVEASPQSAVMVFESSERPGGKILTARFAGAEVELGADAFLNRLPWATDLANRLGLSDRLIHPATSKAEVFVDGRLRPLPAGPVLGLPTSIAAALDAGLISRGQAARANAMDRLLPKTRLHQDRTVAAAVGARLGEQLVNNLTDPLLSGIYAGDASRLSLRSAAPQLFEFMLRNRSLLKGLAALGPRLDSTPVFSSFQGGMSKLVEALTASLGDRLRCESEVAAITRGANGYAILFKDGRTVEASSVLITVPAPAAASMLEGLSAPISEELSRILYASVAIISLAYPANAFSRRPTTSGVLVQRKAGKLISACTFTSSKWASGAPQDPFLLRCSTGRIDDERWQSMSDASLIEKAHQDLRTIIDISSDPIDSIVTRWPSSFPQYEVGHAERIAAIQREVSRLPGIFITGAAFEGVGIPACIRQGADTAEQAARYLEMC